MSLEVLTLIGPIQTTGLKWPNHFLVKSLEVIEHPCKNNQTLFSFFLVFFYYWHKKKKKKKKKKKEGKKVFQPMQYRESYPHYMFIIPVFFNHTMSFLLCNQHHHHSQAFYIYHWYTSSSPFTIIIIIHSISLNSLRALLLFVLLNLQNNKASGSTCKVMH
jgi:hypothetical protein